MKVTNRTDLNMKNVFNIEIPCRVYLKRIR